jgi:hypothetical protein
MKYCVLILIWCFAIADVGCNAPPNHRPAATRYLNRRRDIPEQEKQNLLNHDPCSLAVLETLASSNSEDVRCYVALNRNADDAILGKLSRDPSAAVRQCVALNHNTPRRILKSLISDPDSSARSALTTNPNWTANEIRDFYRQHPEWDYCIADNPSAPSDVLKELTYGSDHLVLATLARNPSIPPYVINRLANDPDPTLRMMLADNKALPTATLKKLAQDPDQRVREFSLEQLERRQSKQPSEQGSGGKRE